MNSSEAGISNKELKFIYLKKNPLPCLDLNPQPPWFQALVLPIELSRLGSNIIFWCIFQASKRETHQPELHVTNGPFKLGSGFAHPQSSPLLSWQLSLFFSPTYGAHGRNQLWFCLQQGNKLSLNWNWRLIVTDFKDIGLLLSLYICFAGCTWITQIFFVGSPPEAESMERWPSCRVTYSFCWHNTLPATAYWLYIH